MPGPSHLSPKPRRAARVAFVALGLVATFLGILGAFLPVLPTTCFMLLAAWAFSKSSPRLQHWLLNHRRFGPPLRRWREDRCIPVRAKVAALLSMSGSGAYLLLFAPLSGLAQGGALAFLALGALVVLRAPSRPARLHRPKSARTGARPSAS